MSPVSRTFDSVVITPNKMRFDPEESAKIDQLSASLSKKQELAPKIGDLKAMDKQIEQLLEFQ